jgi:hypothetical protein
MAQSSPALRMALALVVATSLLGCTSTDDRKDSPGETPSDEATSFVEDGSDITAVESDAQLITSSLVAASPGSIGLATTDLSGDDLGTRDLGDGTRAIYFPRGCLEIVHVAAAQTATYTFERCSGPNGLRAVTGVVTAKYQVAEGQLHLELTATDLVVNGAHVDWAATADITQNSAGTQRTMAWKAQLSGTTARGRTFGRTNQHQTSWTLGEACFALDGSSDGQVNRREIHTEIQNFRRCRRACPDAGGKIVIADVTKNVRYELHYDGSNQATFVGPAGQEITIPLLCAQ